MESIKELRSQINVLENGNLPLKERFFMIHQVEIKINNRIPKCKFSKSGRHNFKGVYARRLSIGSWAKYCRNSDCDFFRVIY